jgi:hypothetical protein
MTADYRNHQNGTARHRDGQDEEQVSSSRKLFRMNKTVAHRNVRAAAYQNCQGGRKDSRSLAKSGFISSRPLIENVE